MTVINFIGFGTSLAFFTAALFSTEWLQGTYTIRKIISKKDLTSDLYKVIDSNSTVRVIKWFEYSLQHICVRIMYNDIILSKQYDSYWKNVTRIYKSKEKKVCYDFEHIGSKLPLYAVEEIKRFTHVYIYIWCTVGMVATGTILSLIDIFVNRSKIKTILKYTGIGFCFVAGICGMIGMLLARIERSLDSHLEWKYLYSFVFGCVGESVVILMIVYNLLEYYLRTRKQVAEDRVHLTQESYPLTAT